MRQRAHLFFAKAITSGYLSSTMPEYRRPIAPGATFFFTFVTDFRQPISTGTAALGFLRTALREETAHHPFEIDAIVILPDHLHRLCTGRPVKPPDFGDVEGRAGD